MKHLHMFYLQTDQVIEQTRCRADCLWRPSQYSIVARYLHLITF